METKYFKNSKVYVTWHLAVGATAAIPSCVLSIRKGQSPDEVKVWGEKESMRETSLVCRFLTHEARNLHIPVSYICILNSIPYTKGRKVKQGQGQAHPAPD